MDVGVPDGIASICAMRVQIRRQLTVT